MEIVEAAILFILLLLSEIYQVNIFILKIGKY